MLRLLGVDSSWLYKPRLNSKRSSKDSEAVAALLNCHLKHPRYGVRRLAVALGWSLNKTRHTRDLAGVRIVRRRKARPGFKQEAAGNLLLEAAKPDGRYDQTELEALSVWSVDYTPLKFGGRTSYLSVVVDLASRRILSWDLGRN